MEIQNGRVNAYLNNDFFEMVTYSTGMLGYAEPSVLPHYLSPDVGDATLGSTLRMALAASKRVSTEEFQRIFQSGVIQQQGKEREAAMMQKYGYKTRRAMYKSMRNCSVNVVGTQIKIQPTHHQPIDSYTATKDGPEPLVIDASVSDAELGAALREAFKRCTSSV